jgi:serine phosphatase RsbU (regulator of sigma subunit)
MPPTPYQRLLSALLLPAAAWLALSALQVPREAYTGLGVLGDRVAAVDPGSPAERAGIRPGDRLAELAPSAGPPAVGLDPRSELRPGVPVVLTRVRDGRSSRVWLAPTALPDGPRRLHMGLLVVASGFLLLGSWVWSERRDALTRAFWLLCASFSVLLAGPLHAPRGWADALDLVYTGVQLVLPALFVHFFALFPDPGRHARAPLGARVAYVVAFGLLAAWAIATFARGLVRGPVFELLQLASGVWLAVGVFAGIALFLAAFARHPDRDARRRLRVALAGTVLGAAPLALVIASRTLAPGTSIPGERLSPFATLLVPASFAWAIAVHRVFDFRVALRAVAGLLALVLGGLALFAAAGALAAVGLPTVSHGAIGAALVAILFVSARVDPLRSVLGEWSARVVPIADERALLAWRPPADAVREGSAAALLESACDAVMLALRLDGCAAIRTGPGAPAMVAQAGARRFLSLSPAWVGTAAALAGPRALHELKTTAEDQEALELAGIHWTLSVPGEPPPAVLLLGRRLTGSWLDQHEARELERFAEHLGVAMENAELRREARTRGLMDRELEVAHDIQVRRLPRRAPVFPTLDCAAASLSSEAVGGDFYDFLQDAPRAFTLAVGDAAGHGVPAALVQAGVQARFRDAAVHARTPADVLAALNRQLAALDQPDRFMGLLCARVDVAAGLVRVANAGLTPPLVRRADGRAEELTAGGLLLGVSADATYETTALELGPGDLLVVYTDGLSEARRGGQMFGPEGVRRVLDRSAHRRAADIVDELLNAVRAWTDEPMDDVTLVVIKQITRPLPARGRIARPALKLEPIPADTPR